MNDKIVETVTNGDGDTKTFTTSRWVVNGEPEDREEWKARHEAVVNEFLNESPA